jgi:hypothetical protein
MNSGLSQNQLPFVFKDPLVVVLGAIFIGAGLIGGLFWLGGSRAAQELLNMFLPLIVIIWIRTYWLVTTRYST